MSTDCVFDPKYNIVAVDPDKQEVIQIPGTEFQAPVTNDSYEQIVLWPNFNPGQNNSGNNPGYDWKNEPRDGEFVLGVSIENLNRYGIPWGEGRPSTVFRIREPHLFNRVSKDLGTQTSMCEYDKYIEHTDFWKQKQGTSGQNARGWVRFKWQEMLDDGLSFGRYASDVEYISLNFFVDVYRNANSLMDILEIPEGADILQPIPLPTGSGPYAPPITIPVRVYIRELQNAGIAP